MKSAPSVEGQCFARVAHKRGGLARSLGPIRFTSAAPFASLAGSSASWQHHLRAAARKSRGPGARCGAQTTFKKHTLARPCRLQSAIVARPNRDSLSRRGVPWPPQPPHDRLFRSQPLGPTSTATTTTRNAYSQLSPRPAQLAGCSVKGSAGWPKGGARKQPRAGPCPARSVAQLESEGTKLTDNHHRLRPAAWSRADLTCCEAI